MHFASSKFLSSFFSLSLLAHSSRSPLAWLLSSCDALTGMKWLNDNAGGLAKFCKGRPDAFTTSPVAG
jgi:hypothetical protein